MRNSEWKKFKSGSDIRGVASGGVEGQDIDLTDEVIEAISGAFVLWLTKKSGKSADDLTVALGHDSRISAVRIKNASIKSFLRAGVHVLDCGMASTPAMFMTTLDLKADAAVQITASHHPFNRNGLKFFTKDGGLDGSDISDILDLCARGESPQVIDGGSVQAVDYIEKYCERLKNMIIRETGDGKDNLPLAGLKILVDAGNGAGGFYANKVLEPLGADISASLFLDPDGMFPNHSPNPEDSEAMNIVCRAVLESKSDLGIIFDADVDRCGAVSSNGQEINRNRLVALASAIVLKNNRQGTIVTDSITSAGLNRFIENHLGGTHYRYRRGYKNVINKAIELNNCGINSPLAIETSGHAAFRENHFLDDGAYLATKIIIKAANLQKKGKSLEDLTKALEVPEEEAEFRLKIKNDDFASAGEKVIFDLLEYSEKQGWKIADDNREGIRVYFEENEGNGWFLLRLSVHDPIMPLNLESYSTGGLKIIAARLYDYLIEKSELDISPIEEFLR